MRHALVRVCLGLVIIGAFAGPRASVLAAPDQGSSTPPAALGPLHTSGAKFLNAQGQEVRLTGVNWFGLETSTFAPHGLWARNYGDMLDQMVAAGFNTLRLPYSNQLLDPASLPQGINYQLNPDLQGLNGLQVMDRIIAAAGQRGLSVILDRHRPTAAAQSELWYTPDVPESRWIQDWVMLAQRYASNPAVIGADLHNEPHGSATWGDGNPATDWRLAAERAGNAILAANPNWLIIVEGIEHNGNDWYWWGGNLAGAQAAPVRLSVPGKLVYSTHDYGPGVYQQAWFHASDFPANLPGIWRAHWAFLQQDNIAPVLVGEFGGRSVGSDAEGVWQRSLLSFLRDNNLSYTYWAWNPDSGDTGGILDDDWKTLDQSKLAMLEGYQWPQVAAAAAAPPASAGQPAATDQSQTQPTTPAPVAAAAPPSPTDQADGQTPDTGQAQPTTDQSDGQTPDTAQAAPAADAQGQPADQAQEATPAAVVASAPAAPAPGTSGAPVTATAPGVAGAAGVVVAPVVGVAQVGAAPLFAPGGPFDPDLQHALSGIGGPNDPDAAHRQARAKDEQIYLAEYGKPWQYAAYITSPTGG